MIDHSIEIESNKRIRMANLNPWTLHFKDPSLEGDFCTMKEDMFKSNMMCCLVIWIFIVFTQVVILPRLVASFWTYYKFNHLKIMLTLCLRCPTNIISLVVTTFLLCAACILVMAEEFKQLPTTLQHMSSMLVHNRNRRTFFICGIVVIMSFSRYI